MGPFVTGYVSNRWEFWLDPADAEIRYVYMVLAIGSRLGPGRTSRSLRLTGASGGRPAR
jgi:hypothetical protein